MTKYLDSTNTSLTLTGADGRILDFGGTDSYSIAPRLSGSVTLVDNQSSHVILPAGLVVNAARFHSDGVEFTILGETLTLLGHPERHLYVLGEESNTPISFAELAEQFGTSVPEPGAEANSASHGGFVQGNGHLELIETTLRVDASTTSSTADTENVCFDIQPGNYSHRIAGFGSGDILVFPEGNAPTLRNENYSDGQVTLTWASETGVVRIELTGLSTSEDGQLQNADDFTDLFGASAIL
jgi:hypothetical protein